MFGNIFEKKKFETALEEQVSLVNLILTQYAFETENLVSIINMAIQGLVHSSILDVKTLKEQIKDIKTQLPTGESLPINLDDSGISELLRLSTTNVIYIKDVLVFNIEIPLVNNYEFILYRTIPLPINVFNNTYMIIVPTSHYIAIDKSRLYYLKLSEVDLGKCKHVAKTIICPYDQQLYHLDKSCELMIFRKPNILPNSCTVKNINFNFSIWHRLENTNSWIYITNQDNIIIKCRDQTEIETINVNGTGILDLSNQCEANTDDGTLLLTKRKITTKIYKDVIPQLNVSINLQIPQIKNDKNLDSLVIPDESKTIVKSNLNKLLEYSKNLENLGQTLHDNNEFKTDNHLYMTLGIVIISMGLLLVIISFIVLCIKIKNNNYCNKKTNCVEEEAKPKVYEELSMIPKPTPGKSLPRII